VLPLQLSRPRVHRGVSLPSPSPSPLTVPVPAPFPFLFSSLESSADRRIGHHNLEMEGRIRPHFRDIGWQHMGPSCDVPDHIRTRHRTSPLACPITAVKIDIGLREQADILHTRSVGLENCSFVSEAAGIGCGPLLVEEDTGWSCNSLT